MKNRKIAVVLGRVYMGGTTEVAKMVGEELSKKGYSVEFIILDRKAPGRSSLEKLGLPIIQKAKSWNQSWTTFSKEIGDIFSAYDGIILNGSFARVGHSALEFTSAKTAVIDIQHIAVNPEEPAVIAQQEWDAVVGVSPMIGVLLENYYSNNRKIKIISNGVEVPEIEPQQDQYGQKFRIAYVGRIRERAKRVSRLRDIAIKLVEHGVDFELLIIGDGEDRNSLEKSFEQSLAEKYVTFLGKLEHKEVYDILSTCHASILVSDHESFGLVLPEAQMCGAVPVSTRILGVTDKIIDDTVNGFLCGANDMDEMANCFAKMAADRNLWKKMSENARKQALHQFSSTSMGEKYENLLREIWEEKRSDRFKDYSFFSYRLEILAWPADGIKRFVRKIWLSLEEIFGRICEIF